VAKMPLLGIADLAQVWSRRARAQRSATSDISQWGKAGESSGLQRGGGRAMLSRAVRGASGLQSPSIST